MPASGRALAGEGAAISEAAREMAAEVAGKARATADGASDTGLLPGTVADVTGTARPASDGAPGAGLLASGNAASRACRGGAWRARTGVATGVSLAGVPNNSDCASARRRIGDVELEGDAAAAEAGEEAAGEVDVFALAPGLPGIEPAGTERTTSGGSFRTAWAGGAVSDLRATTGTPDEALSDEDSAGGNSTGVADGCGLVSF